MAEFTFRMACLNLGASPSSAASLGSAAPSTAALLSPTTSTAPSSTATTIDRNGDLYLVVGSEKRTFQVDSCALIRVSKVWKSMLTGCWAESRPASGAWVVTLASDRPRAIEILLHIIHLNTRQIPRAGDMNVEDLFHVAVAVDMYDLGGCLGLWAKSWCSAVAPVVKPTTEVEILTQLIWIAWVFRDENMFQHVLQRLVEEVEADGEGRLVNADGVGLEDLDFLNALDLLDHLATSRAQLITSLLAVLESSIQTAITTSKLANPSPFCRSTSLSALRPDSARYKARADCTAAILGSFIQSLAAEDLFPLPSGPEEIFESAGALRQRLVRVVQGIETLGIPGGGARGSVREEAHAGCNPKGGLLHQLNNVMVKSKSPPTEAHIKHLRMAP